MPRPISADHWSHDIHDTCVDVNRCSGCRGAELWRQKPHWAIAVDEVLGALVMRPSAINDAAAFVGDLRILEGSDVVVEIEDTGGGVDEVFACLDGGYREVGVGELVGGEVAFAALGGALPAAAVGALFVDVNAVESELFGRGVALGGLAIVARRGAEE